MMEENTNVTMNEEKDTQNTAIMDRQQFTSFIKSQVTAFLATYNLSKIIIDVGNGYKGSVKINKNGEYETEVTFKEVM